MTKICERLVCLDCHYLSTSLGVIVKLRPYQNNDLQRLREAYRAGFRSPLLVAPTGYGKTVLFCYVAAGVASRRKRVAILCHRVELIDQTIAALKNMGLTCGVIADGYEQDLTENIQVASVWTLKNRLYSVIDPDLVIIDEAHHCTLGNTWGAILKHWQNAKRLGDRKSTRLNSSHTDISRMPSSA